jgi:DNA-binding CsgD family transcriptional regulator
MAAAVERVTSPSFVGRRKPLARLRAALDRAGEGLAGVLLVGGEAGVGKTRLLAEIIDLARREGRWVLVGGCVDVSEVSLPYAPVVEALRNLVRELGTERLLETVGGDRAGLARLLPELTGPLDGQDPAGEQASSQARLFDLVLRLLERLSLTVPDGGGSGRPVLLALEDMHWADRSTLDLLTFLTRNLSDHGVLLVATYRSDELHRRHPLRPVLAELDRSGRVERIELARFTHDEVVEQLTGILGEPPSSELVEDVWCRSEGNPFFAEELVAAARAGSTRVLPPTLRDILLARLEHLPEAAQHVLRVAAASGYRVDHRLLAAVAGLPIAQLLEALRLAVTNQVLVPDDLGEAYTFRHALVQEALYGELLPGERTAMHTAFAEAITARRELAANPAAALAHHWYRAHELARALPAAVEAGKAAQRAYAFAEAQQLYERALSLWDKVPEAAAVLAIDRVTLLDKAAQCAYLAGDYERAHALTNKAIGEVDEDGDPSRAGLLHARLGRYRWFLGRRDALDAYERALALVPPTPSPERARVLAAYGTALMLASRYAESKPVCEQAIEVARKVGARAAESDALNTLGCDLVEGFGEIEEGLDCLRKALALAEEVGGIDEQSRAWGNLTAMLALVGWHEQAYETAMAGADAAARLGLRHLNVNLRSDAAQQLFRLGRWDEAERLLPRFLPGPVALSKDLLQTIYTLGRLRIFRGSFDDAASLMDIVRRSPLAATAHVDAIVRYLSAQLAFWQGRFGDAQHAAAGGLAAVDPGKLVTLVPVGMAAAVDEVERATAGGDGSGVDAARGMAERLHGMLVSLPAALRRLPRPSAKLALAEAEWDRLTGRVRPETWTAVVARWDELGDHFQSAYARWRQAEALAAARGAREEIAEALRPALAAARSLGARPLIERVEALARRSRIDVDHPRAEAPTPAAMFRLTPREAEVLALVAAGQSNRQIGEALFISAKTASVHVSNILAKLGVASRAEAAATAWRLGLVPTDKDPT